MKKDKNTNFRTTWAILVGLLLLTTNVLAELINSLKTDLFLLLRVSLAILILILIGKNKRKFSPIIKKVLLFWSIVFFINIILNMVNIYEIDKYQFITSICQASPDFCSTATALFFKFKIFRFITLSSYFFTLLIFPLLFLSYDIRPKFNIEKISYFKKAFFLVLTAMIFLNSLKSLQSIYLSIIQSYQVRNENFDDRFTFKKGGASYYGWIRVYSNFIISQTTEESNILVPPQADAYKMEGNISYFRWFMYPRELYHLDDLEKQKSIKIDYVVLSAGECDNNQCVWPNYQINENKIDKIILIDRKTQTIEVLSDVEYNPENFYQKWGLIKLK